jgi:PAS domain S-box-containing protein
MKSDKVSVLIIDDDPNKITLIERILHTEDVSITKALGGEEGYEKLRHLLPDLVLLDVMMPGISGIDICQKIKSDPLTEKTVVLLLSAVRKDHAEQLDGFSAGADGYILLPASNKELFSRIYPFIRIIKSEKQLRLNQDLFVEIFNSVNEGIIMTSLSGTIIEFNETLLELTDLNREELIGKNAIKVARKLLPPKEIPHIIPIIAEVLTGKKIAPFLIEYNDKFIEVSTQYNRSTQRITGVMRDVTQQKRTEQALRERQRENLSMINNLPGFIYRCANDPDWTMQYISEGCFEITGYKPKHLINNKKLSFNDVIHPDHQERLWDKWQKLLKTKTVFEDEYTINHADGSIRWVWERGRGVYSDKGELLFLEGFITDITPRKQLEFAWKESEGKFRTMFESSPIGIELYDKNGIQVMANQASFDLFGITDDSSAGFNLFDGTSLSKSLKEKLKKGKPVFYEASFDFDKVKELGQYHTMRKGYAEMSYIITPIFESPDEPLKGYLLQVQDITKRKRAEKIQKVLFNISNAVITTKNVADLVKTIRIELGNLLDTENFYLAFYDPKTDTLTAPYWDDPYDEIKSWKASKSVTGRIIEANQSMILKHSDIQQLLDDGVIENVGTMAECWLGVPLHDGKNIIGAFVVQSYLNQDAYTQEDMEMLEFVSDQISLSLQRKQTEQELQNALDKAQESDQLKSAFLANMSHEIRTPMNAILGFSGLLGQSDATREEQNGYIDIIQNSGKKLMRLIDDIVDISKLEANQIKIEQMECDIFSLVETTMDSFLSQKELIEKPAIDLSWNIDSEDIPRFIQTDPIRLQQILDNLITNAIKFTSEGSITLNLKAIQKNNIPYLEFAIKDTGKGIDQQKQDIIFERFRQVEEKGYRQGAGLGLSISKALIELLGGNISVTSEPGEGTTFTFIIPLKATGSYLDTSKTPSSPQKLSLADKTIWIAEDDDNSYNYIEMSLRATRATIKRAEDGRKLMQMFAESSPDILLLDINMPEKTGFECLREIRKNNHPAKVIVQTAYAMEDERKRCYEAGCDAYLAKPFSKKMLLQKIADLIHTS